MISKPMVSVITPCLNSAEFLEETIRSVLAQNYDSIEYLVMDGGSTDGTLTILERYKDRLQYVSEPDAGAADAINRGLRRAQGGIVTWLSSDDTYLPGAVTAAVNAFEAAPNAAVVYGQGWWTDEVNKPIRRYPTVSPFSAKALERECVLCQPACWMRRPAVESVGLLDTSLHSAFDYDLWIRLSRKYPFVAMADFLATSRMHRRNKSLGEKRRMFEESIAVLRRHYGYVPVQWVYGYLEFLKSGRDQFFTPARKYPSTYLRSFVLGSRLNTNHLFRYWGEWVRTLCRSWPP